MWVAVLLSAVVARIAPAQDSRPNVVLIVADDLGFGDLGSYGSPVIVTPNIDRIAQGGVRLTHFYSAQPLCTPSRAALLTGRYPIRSGLVNVLNVLFMPTGGIDVGEVTLGEAMRDLGYATALVGKWHLGLLPAYRPTRHGFDHYFGTDYLNGVNALGPLYRNDEVVEDPVVPDDLLDRYTADAVDFIGAAADHPFLLVLAYQLPHSLEPIPARFIGGSAGGPWGDRVEAIDWGVGQVLAALDAAGIADNTLVLFTSDNGPPTAFGFGSAGDLRGGKASVYEGGLRVPCVLRWPARLPAGGIVDAPVIDVDVMPTLLALAGGRPPTDRTIDGRNVLNVLAGVHSRHAKFFFYNEVTHYGDIGGELWAVTDGRWKLHLPLDHPGLVAPAELYDLRADPGETVNLALGHPGLVRRLTRMGQRFDAAARATARPPVSGTS